MTIAASNGRQDLAIEAGTSLFELGHHFSERYDGVLGCIAYGSCLRSGNILDGLFDLYLIVEGYRQAHGTRLSACFNWLLPPNVYYAEVPVKDGLTRVKYSILSLRDLERGCGTWFESYVWGRFAQPVGLIGFASTEVRNRVMHALDAAAMRLVCETLPLMTREFTSRELWTEGLARSYHTELRAEKPGRVIEIFDYAPEHYEGLAVSCLRTMRTVTRLADDRWRSERGGVDGPAGRGKWQLRRVLGTVLSICRLFKAYYTFRDGIDYLAWKLSRHSGRTIEVPMRVRRFPLVFGWTFFFRLYREGVFK